MNSENNSKKNNRFIYILIIVMIIILVIGGSIFWLVKSGRLDFSNKKSDTKKLLGREERRGRTKKS